MVVLPMICFDIQQFIDMSSLNTDQLAEYVAQLFDSSVIPSLFEYIKIDNLSRAFDPKWQTNGKLETAAQHIIQWVRSLDIAGIQTEIIKDQHYSPIIFTQIKGDIDQTVFFYGHFDKQPPMVGWNQGIGATKPAIIDGKLYGRGGADDGYSTYSTMLAIKALQKQGVALPRCVMITQGDEQSGSTHMSHYLPKLKERIGEPAIFFCLDSGAMDYKRLWLTTSLRGNMLATLKVSVTSEGLHSGGTSGAIPSCFRIARHLLGRIQNFESGEVNQKLHTDITPNRYKEMVDLASLLGEHVYNEFPFLEGVSPISKNPLECLLRRNWHPSFTVIGQSGFPEIENAGNVLLPSIQIRFTIRLPPTFAKSEGEKVLREILLANTPYNAKVQLKNIRVSGGWSSNKYQKYFEDAISEASDIFYKQKTLSLGEGGTIPLMNELNNLWPGRQFLITGVLGPKSNAHGPNQFLDIQYTKKLTCCLAYILAKSSRQMQEPK